MTREMERRVEQYLRGATRGLWGRERGTVQEELECHIRSSVAALVLEGMGEAEALERTLAELGGPGEVNTGMAKLYALPWQVGIALQGALQQFRTRRLESVLIVVAVALGVGVAVAVGALWRVNRALEQQTKTSLAGREITITGNNHVSLFATKTDAVDVQPLGAATNEPTPVLSFADLAAAKKAAPAVDYAYVIDRRGLGGPGKHAHYVAVTPEYFRAANVVLSSGSLFTASDYEAGGRVALAMPELLARFGVQGDPTGQTVLFVDRRYAIAGVIAPEESNLTASGYIPEMIVPFAASLPSEEVQNLKFAVDDPADLDEAQAQLADFARQRWGDRVSLVVNKPPPGLVAQQHLADLVLAIFSSAALLLSGLGIMNLMLGRALTRQREIGIRRSLGATRGIVGGHFVADALFLGLSGGLLGLAVGYAFLIVLNGYRPADLPGLDLSWTVALFGVALALVFSLLFSLYPAWNASRARIVDALGKF